MNELYHLGMACKHFFGRFRPIYFWLRYKIYRPIMFTFMTQQERMDYMIKEQKSMTLNTEAIMSGVVAVAVAAMAGSMIQSSVHDVYKKEKKRKRRKKK